MAIRNFKEIIDNKGYRISSKDRDIFEEGSLQSFFGMSDNDYIEFIVYDANDNQLPLQITDAGDTSLVKYIKINSETIRNYFMIAEGTVLQKGGLPSEYFIDVERLLSEAGYTNGIFRTQITLINRRLGTFDDTKKSKMWVKEISPSRTEVRLLPQRNSVSSETDILTRFQIFKNGGEFRDDTVFYAPSFVRRIDSSLVEQFIRDTYSEKWLLNLESEFNISIDTFSTRVYSKFNESMNYEFDNRYSSINSNLYGKKKDREPTVELSVETIKEIAVRRLTEIINYYLPTRITEETESDTRLEESIDDTGEVLQRRESDILIQPSIPNLTVSIENIDTVEQIEFDSKVDDEAQSFPNTDSETPVITPNGNSRRVINNDNGSLNLEREQQIQ